MCGITLVHRIDGLKANTSIMKRYRKQRNRGSDGFGYIAIHKNKLVSYRRAKLESQIESFIKKEMSQTVLFHHRYPTSTPNFKESAHPIKVSNISLKYDYYLVHNGVITNPDDLKEKHEGMGFVYNTEIIQKYVTTGKTYKEICFNDSEALAIEIALAIDKGNLKIEATGSIAFIVAKVHKSSGNISAIYYGRNNGNPLKFSQTRQLISIGSESEGTLVPANLLHKLDLKTNEITSQKLDMPAYNYNNYGYSYNEVISEDTTSGYIPYGDEDEDSMAWNWAARQAVLNSEKWEGNITEEVVSRWNQIDWEIMKMETVLDSLMDSHDGSPDKENNIIECEAVIDSLRDERDRLDKIITNATIQGGQ